MNPSSPGSVEKAPEKEKSPEKADVFAQADKKSAEEAGSGMKDHTEQKNEQIREKFKNGPSGTGNRFFPIDQETWQTLKHAQMEKPLGASPGSDMLEKASPDKLREHRPAIKDSENNADLSKKIDKPLRISQLLPRASRVLAFNKDDLRQDGRPAERDMLIGPNSDGQKAFRKNRENGISDPETDDLVKSLTESGGMIVKDKREDVIEGRQGADSGGGKGGGASKGSNGDNLLGGSQNVSKSESLPGRSSDRADLSHAGGNMARGAESLGMSEASELGANTDRIQERGKESVEAGTSKTKDVNSESFNGKLKSPDGKQTLEVKDNEVIDSSGKVIGKLDKNGRITSEGEVNKTDINSFKAGWRFEGSEGAHERSFECSNNMANGKIFVPDEKGKPVEYEVRMGMVIDKKNGEQVGNLSAPRENTDGTISGGYFETGDPPKRVALADVPNAVMDLKIMGDGANGSRRIQAATTGAEKHQDGSIGEGRFFNIQQQKELNERHKQAVEKDANSAGGFHPIDDLTGASKERQEKFKVARDNDQKVAEHLNKILETGEVNAQKIHSIESINQSKVEAKAVGQNDKPQDLKTAQKPIEIPKLTDGKEGEAGHDVHSMNGKMRLGNEVYEIKNGSLYKPGDQNPCGEIEPGYKVKLQGRDSIDLAKEPRALMQVRFDGDPENKQHNIMSLGQGRISENGEKISGGLVEATELRRQAMEIRQKAREGDRKYFEDKPYLVEALGKVVKLDDGELALESIASNLDTNIRMLDDQLKFTFDKGLDAETLSNNRLDSSVQVTQNLLKTIGSTGAAQEQVAEEGRQVNKTISDSAVIAVTTVATAGAGTIFSGMAAAGKLTAAGAIAAEATTAVVTGAAVSTLGRASSSSNELVNAGTGAVEGLLSAAGSAGSRAMAEAGWTSWGAYKLTEAAVQTVGYTASGQLREGKSFENAMKEAFDPKTVAIGIAAQMLGEGAGKLASKAATAAGAAEKGLINDFIQDAANSYSNAATAAIGDAKDQEKSRIAKEHGIAKDQVSDELFMQEVKFQNIATHMHEAGIASLATAGATSILSHGARRSVENHMKTAAPPHPSSGTDSAAEIPTQKKAPDRATQDPEKTHDRKSTSDASDDKKITDRKSTSEDESSRSKQSAKDGDRENDSKSKQNNPDLEAKRQEKIAKANDGKFTDEMKVTLNPNKETEREVKIHGQTFKMEQRENQIWYRMAGKENIDNIHPVKVHVNTDGAADLGKLQAVLIPALVHDPELKSNAVFWKTMDPHIGTGGGSADHIPDGKGQRAKAFTIYAENAEAALKIQAKVDRLLVENGLDRQKPIATGNVDAIHGKSNRVGLVFDTAEVSSFEHGYGATLQKELSDTIHKENGLKPGEKLSPEQITKIEKESGIKPGSLRYDNEGKLAIVANPNNITIDKDGNAKIYLEEENANKSFGKLNERPAYYALTRRFMGDADPAVLAHRAERKEQHSKHATHESPAKIIPELANLQRGTRLNHKDANWTYDGINPETGNAVLYAGQERGASSSEFKTLNFKQPEIDKSYKIRRTNGNVEDGWVFKGLYPDGSYRMVKERALKIELKQSELLEQNKKTLSKSR